MRSPILTKSRSSCSCRPWFAAIVVAIAAAGCQNRLSDEDATGANNDIHERIAYEAQATLDERIACFSIRETDAPAELKAEGWGSGAAVLNENLPQGVGGGSIAPGDSPDPIENGPFARDRDLQPKDDSSGEATPHDPFAPKAKAKAKVTPDEGRRNNDALPLDSNPPRSASAAEAAKRDEGRGSIYESPSRPKSTPPTPSPMAPTAPAETRDPRH